MTAVRNAKRRVGPQRERRNLAADIATLIVGECLEMLGADAGFVATIAGDGRTLEVARVTPYARDPVRLTFPVEAPYPLAEAIRTRRPLFIPNNEQLACDHPGIVRVEMQDHACATLPLFGEDGELLGALNFGFDEPRQFTDVDVELIDVVGRRCAQAMTLARRLQDESRRFDEAS